MRLPEERLTRKVFNWDRAHRHPWSKEVLEIFSEVNLQPLFLNIIQQKNPDMFWLPGGEIMFWLFENEIFCMATYVEKAWIVRQNILYPERR